MNPAPNSETQKLLGSLRVMLRQCHFVSGIGALFLIGNAALLLSGRPSVPVFGLAGGAMIFTGMIGRTAQGILARLELRLRRMESSIEQLRAQSEDAAA